MLYSGGLQPDGQGGFLSPKEGPYTYSVAKMIAETNDVIGIVDETPAMLLLESEAFIEAAEDTAAHYNTTRDELMFGSRTDTVRNPDGIADDISRRFVTENADKPIILLTPFAKHDSTFLQVELPQNLADEGAPIEGIPRSFLRELGQDNARLMLAALSAAQAVNLTYAYDARGRFVGVDASKFWEDTFQGLNPNIPIDPARTVTQQDLLASLTQAQREELGRGLEVLNNSLPQLSQLVDEAEALRLAARSARLAKLGIATSVVATVGVAGLIDYAFGAQRDVAEQLHATGQLNDAQYAEYLELNQEIEMMMQAENVAGQGWLFLATTPLAEARAREMFDAFSNKHNLSQELHDMLGMSLFDGLSVRGQIAENIFEVIPSTITAETDLALIELIEAKQAVLSAQNAYWEIYRQAVPPTIHVAPFPSIFGTHLATQSVPEVQAASGAIDVAKTHYQYAFDDALSHPDGAAALANLLNPEQLWSIIADTAEHQTNLPPEIQAYVDVQERFAELGVIDVMAAWRLSGERDDVIAGIMQNPDVMRDYVAEMFTPDTSPEPIPAPSIDPSAHLERQFVPDAISVGR